MSGDGDRKVDLADFLAAGGDLDERIAEAQVVQIRPARPPASDSAPHGIFVRGSATWEQTDEGCVRLAPYALRVDRDVQAQGGRTVEGVVELECGGSIPFTLAAEVLGDVRALRKALAGLLGSHFRAPRGKLERMLDAWLDASVVEHIETVDEFGFSRDGDRFIFTGGAIPPGPGRFSPPAGSPAGRLLLKEGAPIPVASALLEVWPRSMGCRFTVGALLGIVAYGLVAPVLEALDRGAAPLLAFLHGQSGAGKTTHAGVVQGFFGAFDDTKVALSIHSTALAIELQGYWFRGAVLVVGDGKEGAMGEGGRAKMLGLIQRAGDRGVRLRLNNSGTPQAGHPSRATWLLEGEDLPVIEGSGLARLLVLLMPDAPRDSSLLRKLEALNPDLPIVTRALVEFLLRIQCWDALVAQYRGQVELLDRMEQTSPNAVRLGKSIAAISVGLRVWSDWLGEVGLEPPCTVAELVDFLVASVHEQLDDVEAAKPGEYFLELLRQLLASGAARLGGPDGGGVLVGVWRDDRSVAHVLDDAAIGQIRRHFPDAAGGLKPKRSIARDLKRMGALAESVIGLYKTELIRRDGPWSGVEAVELATLGWVDWFNKKRLLESLGYVPPAEFEQAWNERQAAQSWVA